MSIILFFRQCGKVSLAVKQGNRIKNINTKIITFPLLIKEKGDFYNGNEKYFSDLVDSRDNRGLRHTLVDIVVMSIYAVLCGYIDAENMAFFMKLQEP